MGFYLKNAVYPDPNKPTLGVLFSCKKKPQNHPIINLTNIQAERSSNQTHSALILDEKPNFKQHIDTAISNINKGIAVIEKLDIVCHVNCWSSYTKHCGDP